MRCFARLAGEIERGRDRRRRGTIGPQGDTRIDGNHDVEIVITAIHGLNPAMRQAEQQIDLARGDINVDGRIANRIGNEPGALEIDIAIVSSFGRPRIDDVRGRRPPIVAVILIVDREEVTRVRIEDLAWNARCIRRIARRLGIGGDVVVEAAIGIENGVRK